MNNILILDKRVGSYPNGGNDELFNQCAKAGYTDPKFNNDERSNSSQQVHSNPSYNDDDLENQNETSATPRTPTTSGEASTGKSTPSTSGSSSNNGKKPHGRLKPLKKTSPSRSMTSVDN